MPASHMLLYRIANQLFGTTHSVCYALDILVDEPTNYDPVQIEHQLTTIGYGRCDTCHILYLQQSLIVSGSETFCKNCY